MTDGINSGPKEGDMAVKTFGNEVAIEEDAGVRVDQCMVKVKRANLFQFRSVFLQDFLALPSRFRGES